MRIEMRNPVLPVESSPSSSLLARGPSGNRRRRRAIVAGAAIIVSVSISEGARGGGEDWPRLLGPRRDGTYTGDDVIRAWPKDGPHVLWRVAVGAGFSAPVAVTGTNGKLHVILFHRRDGEEIVSSLASKNGAVEWEHRYPTSYRDRFGFDEGPRGTPNVAGGLVFTYGADGVLTAVGVQDGKKAWSVETARRFAIPESFFGAACSPLVEGDLVIVQVGGEDGGGVVAFDAKSGETRWHSTSHEAGYSSPVAATIDGRRLVIALTREGLVGLDAKTGEVLFERRFRARLHASVNAATPLVFEDRIFVSASYGTGAGLFRFHETMLSEIWTSDESLSSHYATPVARDGALFGFHGRQEAGPDLRCVRLEDGKVLWSEERFGAGTVLLAGDRLWILAESGELTLATADTERFHRLGSARILQSTARAYPALAHGRLFARDESHLVCVDLRP